MKKYKLVDPDIPTKLQHNTGAPDSESVYKPPVYTKYKTPDPHLHNLGQLDGKMKEILESSTYDTYTKINKYNDVLADFLNYNQLYKEHSKRSAGTPSPDIGDADKKQIPPAILQAMDHIPKTLRGKAESIIQTIKESDVLSWDTAGHLLYKGTLVPNSNIADLINDSLRFRKTAKRPPGWGLFSKGVREINIPRTIIANPLYFQSAGSEEGSDFHSFYQESGASTSNESGSEGVVSRVSKSPFTGRTPSLNSQASDDEAQLSRGRRRKRTQSREPGERRRRQSSVSSKRRSTGTPVHWDTKTHI